jgi:hypothetical protein
MVEYVGSLPGICLKRFLQGNSQAKICAHG